VVFGKETSLGLVQLFFGRMATELGRAAPAAEPVRPPLAEDFEQELNRSLSALFGR
jgi:hypothetical protein